MINIRHGIFLVVMIKIVSGQSFLYNPSETHSHIELGNFVAPTGTIQNISDDFVSGITKLINNNKGKHGLILNVVDQEKKYDIIYLG